MTHEQLEAIGKVVTLAGSVAALCLALIDMINTGLDIATKLAKRRRRSRRCGRRP